MDASLNRMAELIPTAVDNALTATFEHAGDENLYGFALFTNDIVDSLYPLANTEERLDAAVRRYNAEVDPKHGIVTTNNSLRWSYGDWGVDGIGKQYFNEINRLLTDIHCDVIDADNDDFAEEVFDSLWSKVVHGFAYSDKNRIAGNYGVENLTFLIVGDIDEFFVQDLNRPEIASAYEQFDPDA